MKPDEPLGSCPICGWEMLNSNSNLHHLVPQLRGGKNGPKVRMHIACHNKIHSVWSENELRDNYYTVDLILSDERIQSFAKWVIKKESNFKVSSKMTNNHKKRRRC